MPYVVFLSYTREKEPDARPFYDELQRQLHIRVDSTADIFKDNLVLKTGDNWQERLTSEIQSATIFLLLLSAQWLKSAWCTAEYETFREAMSFSRHKKIFPVLWVPIYDGALNDDQKKRNDEIITANQVLDFTNLQGHDFKSAEVTTKISKLADDIAQHLSLIHGP